MSRRRALPVPLIVGGRSDAAVRRAALLGDGWIGVWNSARRYAEVVASINEQAAAAGRKTIRGHTRCRCGAASRTTAARRTLLSTAMEGFYQIPFDRFERYSPSGTPADVAEFLAPYVDAGCTSFNLIPQSPDVETAVDGAVEVRRLLRAHT